MDTFLSYTTKAVLLSGAFRQQLLGSLASHLWRELTRERERLATKYANNSSRENKNLPFFVFISAIVVLWKALDNVLQH